jgi:hypothetical protein
MPAEAPGRRVNRTATKEVRHGDPTIEKGAPGIAYKSQEGIPVLPSFAAAVAAKVIKAGEEFIVGIAGRHAVRAELLPGGTVEGSPLFIKESDNSLQNAAGAGIKKFGVQEEEVDSAEGWVWVNFDLRDTF